MAIRLQAIFSEARSLLHRRKISYAALALTLTAGSLYVGGLQPAVATSAGQTPGNMANDESRANHTSPLAASASGDDSSAEADTSQSSHSTSETQTSVTVNGQNIAIPDNGSVNTTMNNGGSTTSVSISHSTSGDSVSSSLNVQVFSQSSSNEEGN